MGFVQFLLVLIIIAAVVLMLPLKFRVKAVFGSKKYANVFFLYPLLRAKIEWDGEVMPTLSIYLFKNRVFKKQLKRKHRKDKHPLLWLKSAVITNRRAEVWYGMKNPFATGMASGVMGIMSGFLKFDELSLHPDFFSAEDYVRISASAEITIGNTIFNYVKNKRNKTRRNNEWSKA
jgi:uncharacterized membrane protein YfcA